MDSAEFNRTRDTVKPHDHAVFVYDDTPDVLQPLHGFIREGLENDENVAFVHAFDPEDCGRTFVTNAHAEAERLMEAGRLLLNHYRAAFEASAGAIDHEHVDHLVTSLVNAAKAADRKGLRIFVDASREYFDADRMDEWFAFEEWLGPRLHAECGLVCAYRRSDLERPGVLAKVLATHAYRFDAPAT